MQRQRSARKLTSDDMISLDVGCGTNPKGDVNIDVVRESKHNLLADAHYLPLRDDSISVIFCERLLEHLDNPNQVLSEINRVLNKEGHAHIEVPKPFFANNCRFHLFNFLLNLPFSLGPTQIKWRLRSLRGIREKDSRWFHKHLIRIGDVKNYLNVFAVHEINNVLLRFLQSSRKARFFKFKAIWCVDLRILAKKKPVQLQKN